MNQHQIRQCEDALYAIKYIPGRIMELQIELDAMIPPSPGSVLKMTGRPVAKTPFDTSETETWGIKRALSKEGQEMAAKQTLNSTLRQWVAELPAEEKEFVRLVYGKELPRHAVIRELDITLRKYYRLRERVIGQAWERIREHEPILDMATV